ncbi:MAG TPA: PilZ domain-containing protein [Alteraurantiacibacter sp.]
MGEADREREAPEGPGGRQEERLVADFGVRVVFVDMTHACAGRLRDVSASGGRVAIEGGAKAPRDIYLLARLPGEAEPRRMVAKVRWQVGETLGVRFDPPLAPALVYALAGLDGPPSN